MLVYIQSNYNQPDLIRQTPESKGIWKGIQFTFEEVDTCDFIIVINHPMNDIKVKCRKGGKILLMQEPPHERNTFFKYHFRFYDLIISAFIDKQFNIYQQQAGLPWHVDKTYDELKKMTLEDLPPKKNEISWITSNLAVYPQHQIRLDFIKFLKDKKLDFTLFGKGFQFIEDKFQGISPYQYSIAAENHIDKNYFTEKISDIYLSWSMPIYSGCLNLENYFPNESFVQINLNKPEEALNKIKYALENKLWEKNIAAIQQARELVLEEYQFFPLMHKLINTDLKHVQEAKYETVLIPGNGLTKMEELKKSIRSMFIKK